MAFTESFMDELKSRNDIVDVVGGYVRLTKKSRNHFGLCPFHSERTPSFSVHAERQSFHCFGCGKSGDVITFIQEIEHLSFREAVEELARRANMPMPEDERENDVVASKRKRMLELNRDAARFFYEQLVSPSGKACQEYALRRGLSLSYIKKFGLGYAPDSWDSLLKAMKQKGYTEQELLDAALVKPGKKGGCYDVFRNRLMFPVIDIRESFIGFSGRIIGDGEPKYLNSPETLVFKKSQNLFALNLAKKSKSGYIILTEGNLDVFSLHQAGFDSAVASLGTSFTDEQARLISRFTDQVILCYDADNAGRKAAQKAIAILGKLDVKVRVMELPGAKDPDEFIKLNGADAFRNVLDGSAGQLEYRLSLIQREFPPESDASRVEYLKRVVSLLARQPSAVEREVYAARCAEKVGVKPDTVIKEVERTRRRILGGVKKDEEKKGTRGQLSDWKRPYKVSRQTPAAEGLIGLLACDPSLADRPDIPPPERIDEPLLRRLYETVLRRCHSHLPPDDPLSPAEFTADEQGVFAGILSVAPDMTRAEDALRDYIAKLKPAEEKDLRALAASMKEKKGYGG